MARGLPVVASAVSGVPTTVAHEKRGLLYEPSNMDQLIAEILRVSHDRALRKHCIDNGYAFAREHTVEAETAAMMKKVFSRWPHLEKAAI
jgi:glycosyltransferase involved in cell wall biosynthesis